MARAGLKFEDEDETRNDKIAALLSEIGLNIPENNEIAASLLGLAATGIRDGSRRRRPCSSASSSSSSSR